MKKISIITPCLNAAPYIAETVASVLDQTAVRSKRLELEYIIRDGGSTDGTLKIIEEFRSRRISVVSEADGGLYDALAKGLRAQSGDLCAYINAGDFYSPQAFDVVLDVMGAKPVNWLTGMNVVYNDHAQLVSCSLPFRYRRRLIRAAQYGRAGPSRPRFLQRALRLPFILQEATFWRSGLNDLLDLSFLRGLRYGGDYYLWAQFAKHHDLRIVEAHLAGFRKHAGQISEDLDRYFAEVSLFSEKATLSDRAVGILDRVVWAFAPPAIKKMWNTDGLYRYDFSAGTWT
jgi:glycosyltransferase involved in cell wall biosynthesis